MDNLIDSNKTIDNNNIDDDIVIKTVNLTKKYGSHTAVNSATLNIKKGQIYGIIGKNGAGKTTIMKMILGMCQPTSGELYINGSTDYSKERKKIGSLIEAPCFYPKYSASKNLKVLGSLANATEDDIAEALGRVKLYTDVKYAKNFSLGMKQKLGIALATLDNPDIYILDEPVNGLDPSAIKDIRETILELKAKGKTFIISSHLLDELSKITDRYAIINKGVVVEEIDNDKLMQILDEHSDTFIYTKDLEKASIITQKEYKNIEIEKRTDCLILRGKNVPKSPELFKFYVKNDIDIQEIKRKEQSFEEYFVERLG